MEQSKALLLLISRWAGLHLYIVFLLVLCNNSYAQQETWLANEFFDCLLVVIQQFQFEALPSLELKTRPHYQIKWQD